MTKTNQKTSAARPRALRRSPRGAPRVLMVFVDGLGLGAGDPSVNPVAGDVCPTLRRWLRDHAVPVDACLGVDGLPQSATGQATLLTGVNAARIAGRHVEGLPGPTLRDLVREHNLFSRLMSARWRATFANAYWLDAFGRSRIRRRPSVTTVAAMAAFGKVRRSSDLRRGRAVYQDLTREMLRSRGYRGPLSTPEESARDLLRLAARHHFTLFEFFLTDLAAHKGTRAEVDAVLSRLDRFLAALERWPESPGRTLLLTSDHGNIEDHTTRTHTLNPVPLVALGSRRAALQKRVRSLVDVAPAILSVFFGLRPRRPVPRRADAADGI